MSNNKQSSVDWLARKLKDFPHIKHSQEFKDLVKQARAMHKEEMVNTFKHAQVLMIMDCSKRVEQYYNETFNQETK